ncbi:MULTISPECIES: diacylglycerol/polyprenol kinase family protein [Methanobrevibacter]|uniref:Dolichol kinase n=1 Tax=Methanobrevibacter gottschalkii DSM 11977 TaxID=1122229 RepID=A0A3N5BM64_9EURY|nr:MULTISPECIES: phosphatidate cytidylyltransferase [Methanobrevibacter]OEC94351.1 phosphatidate cytidylyltransferase [Methanobrevibacter sp. A27]RPF50778.1 dolichol kinase [Methanobrevibacter gottschalkii DSM 11977]
MVFTDIIALIVVYIYVAIIFVVAEMVLKTRPEISRKFLHIMVGNMIFAMPFFANPWNMVWFLTLPITIALFFLTDYSPIKIENSVTESGHALGLFFYAGIWTILIAIFTIIAPASDSKLFLWIVALAIVPMVYGDGFAALIGQKFGKIKYTVFGGTKSLEGSLTMFVVTSVMGVFVWMVFYSIGCTMPEFNIVSILAISAVATACEAFSYGGIDNLTVPVITSILYFLVAIL